MNLDQLAQKLIATARENPPSDAVPYAFEKRIVARLSALRLADQCVHWTRALWRSAAACVALALLCGAGSLYWQSPGVAPADLSQQFENTLIAAADPDPGAEYVE